MKRYALLLSGLGLLLMLATPSLAQRKLKTLDEDQAAEEKKYEDPYKNRLGNGKWRFGGNFTGGLSTNGGMLFLQPIAGYMVKPKTMLGAGLTYIYFSQKYPGFSYNASFYGPQAFVRQGLGESLFLHAEYNPINFPLILNASGETKRTWVNQLYLGGGYSPGGGAYIMGLYNVLYDNTNPFGSPWDIRAGFLF
ncbi:MAG: hypothetical protein LCH37_02150 [Bacteroidetes bacterium]|nr:hypothetical protein [Bacteroidota bacterium]MCK6610001.1 hypothetical protein [Bacteroidia bacterium]